MGKGVMMSARTFRFQVILTIIFVLVASTIALIVGMVSRDATDHTKQIPGIVIPVAAGWLAYCYQRRVAFTKALFDIWQKIVGSVQDAIQYTHLPSPTQADYAKVLRELGCRIDDVRGAFRNVAEKSQPQSATSKEFVLAVKESRSLAQRGHMARTFSKSRANIGVYPFESLKQIHGTIVQLGYGPSFDAANAKEARDTIDALWKVLRTELLKELDRDYPEYPDTPFKY